MTNAIKGSCLCKAVEFAADRLAGPGSACHCVMCQKAHGGPFGAYVTLHGHRYTKGEDQVTVYPSSEFCTRSFCRHCGSTLQFFDSRKPEIISFAISALDGDHQAELGAHIFCDTRVAWHPIQDNLPQYCEDDESADN